MMMSMSLTRILTWSSPIQQQLQATSVTEGFHFHFLKAMQQLTILSHAEAVALLGKSKTAHVRHKSFDFCSPGKESLTIRRTRRAKVRIVDDDAVGILAFRFPEMKASFGMAYFCLVFF